MDDCLSFKDFCLKQSSKANYRRKLGGSAICSKYEQNSTALRSVAYLFFIRAEGVNVPEGHGEVLGVQLAGDGQVRRLVEEVSLSLCNAAPHFGSAPETPHRKRPLRAALYSKPLQNVH